MAPRASDGTGLLAAAEAAGSVVVGRMGPPRALDGSGWAAPLRIETVLLGAAFPRPAIDLAWEELAASRSLRFREGERVLVVLAPVPSGSLWARRVPTGELRERTRVVADRSRAFVRAPGLGAVDRLRHYWALSRAERVGPAGLAHLAALVAHAEPPLAVSAAHELGRLGFEGGSLGAASSSDLVRGLLRDDAPRALHDSLLTWIAVARPAALGSELEGRVVGDDAPAILHLALGRLEGGLGPERSDALMAAADPDLRQVGAANAEPAQLGALRGLLARDPVPAVREAAARRAAAVAGGSGFDAALEGFSDPEPSVRAAAADAVARSSAFDAARLREVAFGWPRPAPEAAVLALRLRASSASRAVLEEVAASHPEEGLRALARIALGRDPRAH